MVSVGSFVIGEIATSIPKSTQKAKYNLPPYTLTEVTAIENELNVDKLVDILPRDDIRSSCQFCALQRVKHAEAIVTSSKQSRADVIFPPKVLTRPSSDRRGASHFRSCPP
ncbi:hypothetical protein L915_09142 [Phytophthora nicotianae]|uniref:Uncharacterized protein n=1 Tax=Phytophthora nicotianae TaxID=4792 RepID=W2GV89_PHYNI|nr:hypothetical protein L915_09142 [Phytophthora nicotianae]